MLSFLNTVSIRQPPSLLHLTLFLVIPTALPSRSPKEKKIHDFCIVVVVLDMILSKASVCNCHQNFWGMEKASSSCFKAQKIHDMSYTKTT